METSTYKVLSDKIKYVVIAKKTGSKKRYKQVGFNSERKFQEFLNLFRKEFCEDCGMSKHFHSLVFGYNITIDHIDGNRINNHSSNLRTLCCNCHYNKDGSFRRHWNRVLAKKNQRRSISLVK